MGKETQDTQLLVKRLKLYEAIVNKSQNGVLVFNDQMEVIYANLHAGEIFGASPSALRGKPLSNFLPPQSRASHEKLVAQFRTSTESQQNLQDWRRIESCRLNGELFPASITIEKMPVSTNMVYIVYLIDMSHVVDLETKRNQADLNYFHARQQKKYAASTLQLHLEKSVTQIAKNAQFIKETYDLKPITDAMNNIMHHAFTTLTLSQKVVYISDSLIEQDKLNLVDRSLFGMFERLRTLMVTSAAPKNISIEWNIPAITNKIKLKQDQKIEQILYNLLEDAINNSDEGVIEISIPNIEKISTQQLDLEFHIKTTDYGLTQSQMDMILNDPTNKALSTINKIYMKGLCLRLAQDLTEKLKGSMRIVSHPVDGTNIFVKIRGQLTNVGTGKTAPAEKEPKSGKVEALSNEAPSEAIKAKAIEETAEKTSDAIAEPLEKEASTPLPQPQTTAAPSRKIAGL